MALEKGQIALNSRQGGTQFVRGVRRELSHAPDGGLQPRKHFVQCFRKTLQLIAGLRDLQTVGEALNADPLRGARNFVHRG